MKAVDDRAVGAVLVAGSTPHQVAGRLQLVHDSPDFVSPSWPSLDDVRDVEPEARVVARHPGGYSARVPAESPIADEVSREAEPARLCPLRREFGVAALVGAR